MNLFKRKPAPTPTQREAEMAEVIQTMHKALAVAHQTQATLVSKNNALQAKLKCSESNYSFACQRVALLEMEAQT
jgi:hypothetical protein